MIAHGLAPICRLIMNSTPQVQTDIEELYWWPGTLSTATAGEVLFQNGKTQTNNQSPLAKILNKTEDNVLFIYTAVALLENPLFF